uniref:Uncharacterized protein n=1 Tax=Anthurium amnicola TaxID=1678845 RepID=A0A1D1XF20_9ARAE
MYCHPSCHRVQPCYRVQCPYVVVMQPQPPPPRPSPPSPPRQPPRPRTVPGQTYVPPWEQGTHLPPVTGGRDPFDPYEEPFNPPQPRRPFDDGDEPFNPVIPPPDPPRPRGGTGGGPPGGGRGGKGPGDWLHTRDRKGKRF